jgi:hypothetical protein
LLPIQLRVCADEFGHIAKAAEFSPEVFTGIETKNQQQVFDREGARACVSDAERLKPLPHTF